MGALTLLGQRMRAFVGIYFVLCIVSTALAMAPDTLFPGRLESEIPFHAMAIPGIAIGAAIVYPFYPKPPEVFDRSSSEMEEYLEQREKCDRLFSFAVIPAAIIVAWPLFAIFKRRLWAFVVLRRGAVSYTIIHALIVATSVVYLAMNWAKFVD